KEGGGASDRVPTAARAGSRASPQARTRVPGASSEPLLLAEENVPRLAEVPAEEAPPAPAAVSITVPAAQQLPGMSRPVDDRRNPRPHSVQGPRFFELSFGLGALVALVSALGII